MDIVCRHIALVEGGMKERNSQLVPGHWWEINWEQQRVTSWKVEVSLLERRNRRERGKAKQGSTTEKISRVQRDWCWQMQSYAALVAKVVGTTIPRSPKNGQQGSKNSIERIAIHYQTEKRLSEVLIL